MLAATGIHPCWHISLSRPLPLLLPAPTQECNITPTHRRLARNHDDDCHTLAAAASLHTHLNIWLYTCRCPMRNTLDDTRLILASALVLACLAVPCLEPCTNLVVAAQEHLDACCTPLMLQLHHHTERSRIRYESLSLCHLHERQARVCDRMWHRIPHGSTECYMAAPNATWQHRMLHGSTECYMAASNATKHPGLRHAAGPRWLTLLNHCWNDVCNGSDLTNAAVQIKVL